MGKISRERRVLNPDAPKDERKSANVYVLECNGEELSIIREALSLLPSEVARIKKASTKNDNISDEEKETLRIMHEKIQSKSDKASKIVGSIQDVFIEEPTA